jgi:hypothetical protein
MSAIPLRGFAGRLVTRLEMLPAVAGMMGLVPVHALGVELGVLVAQMLVQLRLGTEPQFALRTLKHVHDSMLLRPYPFHRGALLGREDPTNA